MFTEQGAALIAALRASGFPDTATAAIETYLTSCLNHLVSRGPLDLPGLKLSQTEPSGNMPGEVQPPTFTEPPRGVVQLGEATGPPVAVDGADPPQWKVPVKPIGGLIGGPGGGGGAPGPPRSTDAGGVSP